MVRKTLSFENNQAFIANGAINYNQSTGAYYQNGIDTITTSNTVPVIRADGSHNVTVSANSSTVSKSKRQNKNNNFNNSMPIV